MRSSKINIRNRSTISRLTSAFTIIELIVVISIIGILATITIVSYGNWKQSAIITQLKSDLNGVVAAMENARTFGDTYPTTIPSTFVPSNGVTLSGGGLNSGKGYCVDATNGTQSYNISSQYSTPTVGPCSVLYLDAGIAASYSGSGNLWTDLSGNGNNGTLNNGVAYNSANGGVLDFDGNDDYVSVGDPANGSLDSFNDFTIEAWIKPTSVSSYMQIVSKFSWSSGNYAYQFNTTNTGKLRFDYSTNGTSYGNVVSNTSITAGVWQHVAVTRSGTTVYFYVNGSQDSNTGSFAGAIYNSSSALAIGRVPDSDQQKFNGQIGIVLIRNSALGSNEINQNFNALRGRYGI